MNDSDTKEEKKALKRRFSLSGCQNVWWYVRPTIWEKTTSNKVFLQHKKNRIKIKNKSKDDIIVEKSTEKKIIKLKKNQRQNHSNEI